MLGTLLASSACGGSARPAEPATNGTGAPTGPAAESRRELTPVEAPAGTFAWGRLKNPAALADSLTSATGLPLDWRRLLSQAMPELLTFSDANASLEVVLAVPTGARRAPLGVVSWGVPSEQIVLEALERQNVIADEAAGGVYLFQAQGASCAVGPALGAAPARIVCGDAAEDVDVLGAFAFRGLSQQVFSDADVHFEVVAEPLRAAYGQQLGSLKLLSSVLVRQLQIDNPRFDRAVADTVFGLVDEVVALTRDVERARLQLWDRGGEYEMALAGRFVGAESWSVQTLSELRAAQAAPPEWFWQLPARASAAYFMQVPSAAKMRPFWDTGRDALVGYLEQNQDVGKATRQRIDRWLADALVHEGPLLGASGPLVRTGGEGEGASRMRPAWQLTAVQGDAGRYRKLAAELESLLAAADLRKAAGGAEKGWLPELKARGPLAGKPGSVVYEWRVRGDWSAALEQLGSGLGGAQRDRAEVKAALRDLESGFVALVPDGDRTWFAWALDRERLSEPFALMQGPDAPRVSALKGLAPLQGRAAVASGFFKLEGLVASFASSMDGPDRLRDWEQLSRSLPHRGESPTTFEMRVTGEGGQDVEFVQRIPRAFLADLTAVVSQGLTR